MLLLPLRFLLLRMLSLPSTALLCAGWARTVCRVFRAAAAGAPAAANASLQSFFGKRTTFAIEGYALPLLALAGRLVPGQTVRLEATRTASALREVQVRG